MRVLPRRFWWMALLGLVTNASVSLHILVKSTLVQAQTTTNPTIKLAQLPTTLSSLEGIWEAQIPANYWQMRIVWNPEISKFQGFLIKQGEASQAAGFSINELVWEATPIDNSGTLAERQKYRPMGTGSEYWQEGTASFNPANPNLFRSSASQCNFERVDNLAKKPEESPPCNDPTIQTNYDKSNPNYHFYDEIKNIICFKDDPNCTREKVFSKMISRKIFVAPTTDISPVVNCEEKDLSSPLEEYSNRIKTVINENDFSETNYTLPGHMFYPGKITRKVIDDGNSISVQTIGEGIGDFREFNLFISVPVWNTADFLLHKEFPSYRDPMPTP